MKKHPLKFMPNFLKSTLKSSLYVLADTLDILLGRDSMIPPRAKIFIGNGDFRKTGQEFKKHFIELANLEPHNRVLDVGCGLGRMAVPLTSYLSEKGEYWGFDIVQEGVNWCNDHISKKFRNFHFLHSDVYNKHYNVNGKTQAQNFQFPFDDEFFDFIFLTSVFTHMLSSDLENYLSEIVRVLKPLGKCFITFFILNEESQNYIHLKQSTQDFRYNVGTCLTTDKNDPEKAIAYPESYILDLFEKKRLNINFPIHYGSWCGRDTYLSYQDIIIAEKEA
jgi:ubiquinone/menaquinone biosynthesis C-methylase UbiE